MDRELPSEEQQPDGEKIPLNESALLASEFRTLKQPGHEGKMEVFAHLERDLFEAGFALGAQAEVTEILNDTSLLCRSESFSRAMNLLLDSAPLSITNKARANMCIMASGKGFRVAMQEGFSGPDVGGMVKTVLSFAGDHLTGKDRIGRGDALWDSKPETASVSISGGGEIFSEDVRMVSFRFPIHYFPENLLSETERRMLEEEGAGFIVRHYVPMK